MANTSALSREYRILRTHYVPQLVIAHLFANRLPRLSTRSDFTECLSQFHKLLVAGVNGSAVGLGVTMLPFFDMVFASDKATFYTPYVKLGQIPEAGATLTLPHLLGAVRAPALVIQGEHDRVVPRGAAEAYAAHRERLTAHGDMIDPHVRRRIERGGGLSAADYIGMIGRRNTLVRAVDARIADFDVVAMPTAPVPVPKPAASTAPAAAAAPRRGLLQRLLGR